MCTYPLIFRTADDELAEDGVHRLVGIVGCDRETDEPFFRECMLEHAEGFPLLPVGAREAGDFVSAAHEFEPHVGIVNGKVRLGREWLWWVDSGAGLVEGEPGLELQTAVVMVAGLIVAEDQEHGMR